MISSIALSGGVDLMSVKPAAKAGTLRDCLNFEVGTRDGYTRIDGIARFDGRPGVANIKLWRLKFVTTATVFSPGHEVRFTAGQSGYVLDTFTSGNQTIIYAVFSESATAPGLPATLTNMTVAGTASITSRNVVFQPQGVTTVFGTQANFDTAVAALYTTEKAKIGQVPGRAGSDIIGHFFFRDRSYCVRDLMRVSFEAGYYTDANEGQYVTYNGLVYKILNVRQTGVKQGVLTLDPSPGGVANATPLTAATLASLSVSGAWDTGYTTLPYSDGLTAAGVPPYTWALSGADADGSADLSLVNLAEINFLPQITDAALYRSTSTGWERVALGREMAFRSGALGLANFSRDLTVTGIASSIANVFPTNTTFNGAVVTGPNADDGAETALTGATGDEFIAKGFALTSIPTNAIIRGIEVTVERHSDTANQAQDALIDLLVQNGGTDNKARIASWPNAITAVTYGAPDDLWGSQSITPAELKSSSFGVRVLVKRTVPATAAIGGIDYIKIKVYYQQADLPIYIWDGTTDVTATLRHIQTMRGDTTTGNAEGWMTIDAVDNATKPRLVGDNDQIRTAAAGGGTLLALVAARDRPMWMVGQAEMDNNRSRYRFHNANFYGRDDFDAIYGVSGAGHAFCFDSERYIRIHADLPVTEDLPRHIVKHGDSLALGYYSGAVLLTAVGEPFETRGSEGATAIEIGDRMVALRSLSGDALAVICQSSSWAIRGTTSDTYFKSVISANRGGVEYTDADLGRVVMCDGQGVFAADSAEQFGPAERNYLSKPVLPWLRARLQATVNSEQAYIRPITALNVRSKNQYRLYFWDGYVLTMTNTDPVQFTFQRMFEVAADIHTDPVPWRVRFVSSGIDSSGRERMFVSFYGGVKEGYLFEMDVGRSFDGIAIPAFIETNPVDFGNFSSTKRVDRWFVSGVGGKATVDASRSVNYKRPNFGIAQTMTMGLSSAAAVTEAEPFRGETDLPIEGDDVAFRFDHNSVTEALFSLQYINLYVDARGQSRGTVR